MPRRSRSSPCGPASEEEKQKQTEEEKTATKTLLPLPPLLPFRPGPTAGGHRPRASAAPRRRCASSGWRRRGSGREEEERAEEEEEGRPLLAAAEATPQPLLPPLLPLRLPFPLRPLLSRSCTESPWRAREEEKRRGRPLGASTSSPSPLRESPRAVTTTEAVAKQSSSASRASAPPSTPARSSPRTRPAAEPRPRLRGP